MDPLLTHVPSDLRSFVYDPVASLRQSACGLPRTAKISWREDKNGKSARYQQKER